MTIRRPNSYNSRMNNKVILRIVLALIVAAIGAWQLRNAQNVSEPAPRAEHQRSGQSPSNQTRPGENRGSSSSSAGQGQSASTTGDFDYYLVSLSWSPSYCVDHPQDKRQCGDRGFGFVLHGLWPQKSSGGYPENCSAGGKPSAATVQRTLAFMPSERLINHEWTKHGTCTGLNADQYFALADRAFAVLQIPAGFQAPSSSRLLSSEKIIGEFLSANPGLAASSLTLRCSRGELEEVRLCVDTQLKPRSCGAGVRSQCGRDLIQIRSVR